MKINPKDLPYSVHLSVVFMRGINTSDFCAAGLLVQTPGGCLLKSISLEPWHFEKLDVGILQQKNGAIR